MKTNEPEKPLKNADSHLASPNQRKALAKQCPSVNVPPTITRRDSLRARMVAGSFKNVISPQDYLTTIGYPDSMEAERDQHFPLT